MRLKINYFLLLVLSSFFILIRLKFWNIVLNRTTPDFRLSLGLCPKEIDFRKKRIPIVCKAMKKILGKEYAPRDEVEVNYVKI